MPFYLATFEFVKEGVSVLKCKLVVADSEKEAYEKAERDFHEQGYRDAELWRLEVEEVRSLEDLTRFPWFCIK